MVRMETTRPWAFLGASLSFVALVLVLAPALALARGEGHRGQVLVPVYAQAPVVYSAPAVTYQAAQAPLVYGAPVVAQAPTVAQAPVVAQAPTVAQAPVVAQAPTPGFAPGVRVKPVDRADIHEELRAEAKEGGKDAGSRRERRNALRESARSKYAEAIGGDADAENLNASELQDIEYLVSSILDAAAQHAPGEAPGGGYVYGYPPGLGLGAAPGWGQYAPHPMPMPYPVVVVPPGYSARFIQPMAPVQYLVPVQPRHKLFSK